MKITMPQRISPKHSVATTTGLCTVLAAALQWHAVRTGIVAGLTLFWLAFLPPAQAAEPEHNVTNIAKDGLVTAREIRGTRTFQFRVADPALRSRLRVGAPVYVNFDTKQVSLDGKKSCCTILKISTAAKQAVPGTTPAAPASAPPTQSRAAQLTGNVTAATPRPLATHPQGQQMMSQAAQNAALLDLNFQFLNKSYKNDVYVRDPLGKKHRVSCVRFKSTSGFRFKVDPPAFTLTSQGLTVEQNISKLTADGLTVKVQLGPCADIAAGMGVRLSDIKLVYKAKPMITFDQNQLCRVSWSRDTDELRVAIGDMNITGVQNDIDKLAKDAVREALNAVFDAYFGGKLRGELTKVSVNVCGGGKSGK
ncbi:MAG: hypothetical protein WD823_08420 [Sulfuricaulis sp.]|uniref:hypothetical protein n=1 Tax=Sulfuricaulis sp. TaxID=2003553 RepID=UPI0034A102BB